MKHTHLTKSLLAGITLVAALALTACNSDDTAAGASTPAASASADQSDNSNSSGTGTSTGTGTSSGTSSGTSGSTGNNDSSSTGGSSSSKTPICTTSTLRVTAADNSAGSDSKDTGVVTVQLFNKGGQNCRVSGFPGVDLKTNAGSMSVPRNSEKPYPATLKPGESAAFNIQFPVNNSGGSGVRPTQIVITPPNDTHQATVQWPAGSLPATDGSDSGPKLEVGPANKVG
ncbi:DUF4232 domain-containing protein [Streptomyces sp. NBC_01618]|uniref:DUF4232 domain-containing protein n=1 Tax=Streptomyces sp. NBC_01618 TaxID=2975900 RepID=UPI003865F64D|nr:DUF4232 domain-containing protein [Streptomyces sp. NBC_01618]